MSAASWCAVLMLGWLAVAALINVGSVGQERKPTTPGAAAVGLVMIGLMAAAVAVIW